MCLNLTQQYIIVNIEVQTLTLICVFSTLYEHELVKRKYKWTL